MNLCGVAPTSAIAVAAELLTASVSHHAGTYLALVVARPSHHNSRNFPVCHGEFFHCLEIGDEGGETFAPRLFIRGTQKR